VARAAAALLTSGARAAPAQPVVGIADQYHHFMSDSRFAQLGVDHARIVVPWNAALVGDARTDAWLATAGRRGITPLVAFGHGPSTRCPDAPCLHPPPSRYQTAVAAFLAQHPEVHEVVPWNEPNHAAEPTAGDPGLAAAYYDAARRACPSCTLVAGDLLDADGLADYLSAYRTALGEVPSVWGLHDYYDATYRATRGVDTMLAAVDGEVWLSETGGIVRFGGLPEDEERAAGSIRWIFALARQRPRVARVYVYQWQSTPFDAFDAGLERPDGTERASLAELRRALGIEQGPLPVVPLPVQNSPARPVAARVVPTGVRLGGAWADLSGRGVTITRRGLAVAVSCIAAPRRCDVTAGLVLAPGRRTGLRLGVTPGHTRRVLVRLASRTRAAVARAGRVRLTLCLQAGGRRACRVSLPGVGR
jgi:hypothetical protein